MRARYTKGFLQELEKQYNENGHLHVARLLPAPDFKGVEGQVYEQDKDYKLKEITHDEEILDSWIPRLVTRHDGWIAVPIEASESQDDLWEEVLEIYDEFQYDEDKLDELKERFTITRK